MEINESLLARKTNRFVLGASNHQKFVDVMGSCLDAQIDRRKE